MTTAEEAWKGTKVDPKVEIMANDRRTLEEVKPELSQGVGTMDETNTEVAQIESKDNLRDEVNGLLADVFNLEGGLRKVRRRLVALQIKVETQ